MPTLPQSRVLHIDITGHDAPGVTHALARLLKAHQLGVQIRFRAITGEEYESWVGAQGKGRYLVSVNRVGHARRAGFRGELPQARLAAEGAAGLRTAAGGGDGAADGEGPSA